MVATVFAQGCPLNCSYCHNPGLIPVTEGSLSWDSAVAFLENRRGLLDGVVFSGGEPTRQQSLVSAARDVREMKCFGIGVHTMGLYPARVEALLGEGLVDWFGFDIKASWAKYPSITQVDAPSQASKAQRSLAYIIKAGIPYEARTTIHPALFSSSDIRSLAINLAEAGVTQWVVQRARSDGSAGEWSAAWDSPEGDELLSATRVICIQYGVQAIIR